MIVKIRCFGKLLCLIKSESNWRSESSVLFDKKTLGSRYQKASSCIKAYASVINVFWVLSSQGIFSDWLDRCESDTLVRSRDKRCFSGIIIELPWRCICLLSANATNHDSSQDFVLSNTFSPISAFFHLLLRVDNLSLNAEIEMRGYTYLTIKCFFIAFK